MRYSSASLLSLAVALCLSGAQHASAQASTTTTITATVSTETIYTPTITVVSTEQAADVLTTETAVSTTVTTLADETVTTTLPTVTATATYTSTAAQATVTTVDDSCVQYRVDFATGCCPSQYMKLVWKAASVPTKTGGKKSNGHPKVKSNSHPNVAARAVVGPFPSTAPCSKTSFQDFNSRSGQQVVLVSNYNFGSQGATMRVQDLYAPNVCGDVYIDGVKVASTTCPLRDNPNVNRQASMNDPDAAIASNNYGWVYVTVPAGTHTVTFLETQTSGGQAYYQITSNEQCPMDVYTDERTSTTAMTTYTTTSTTLDPTATITATESTTTTTTAPANTLTATVTPSVVTVTATETFTPAAAQVTTVSQCRTVVVPMACPRVRSKAMLAVWEQQQLQSYKAQQSDKQAALSVTCASGSKYAF